MPARAVHENQSRRAHDALATAGESASCRLQWGSRLKEEVWMGSMRRLANSSVSTESKCCWSAESLGTEGRGHSLLDPSTATSSTPCTPAVTHLERGDNVQSNRVPSSHPGGKERWAGWAGQL